MKHIILAAILLAPLTSCTGFYQQVVNKQVANIKSLNAVLATVNSAETANAASNEIAQYGKVFLDTVKEGIKSGTPNIIELLMIKNQLTKEGNKEASLEFIGHCIRLYSANFYGSKALKTAVLSQFIKTA